MPSHAPVQEPSPDPLRRERDHLSSSRSALRAMRHDVEALDICDVTGNWVNAKVLAAQIEDRIKALADLADTPLFFGRLDYLHAPGGELAEGAAGESFYIGRRHVHDARGRPDGHRLAGAGLAAVLPRLADRADGRAAAPPVRLHRGRPDRLRGRAPVRPDRSRPPPASCSRPRSSGRASARCATSSRRSSPSRTRSSARASPARSACRAGPAPGRPRSACTGWRICSTRTASGWPAPARWSSGRTRPSCSTSSRCCPRSASSRSSRPRWTTWWRHVPGARHGLGAGRGGIKGDARMAEVLRAGGALADRDADRAGRGGARLAALAGPGVRTGGDRRGVGGAGHPVRRRARGAAAAASRTRCWSRWSGAGRGAGRPGAGRGGPQLRGEGGGRGACGRRSTRRSWCCGCCRTRSSWPSLRGGAARRRGAEGGAVGQAGAAAWRRRSGRRPTRCWSTRRPTWCERTHSLGHVVLDEAQDLSPMQYRAVGRRCSTGSATSSGTSRRAPRRGRRASGTEALEHLGKPDARVEELTARLPRAARGHRLRVAAAAAHRARAWRPPTSVRETGGRPSVRAVAAAGWTREVVAACGESLAHEGSIGLIAADARGSRRSAPRWTPAGCRICSPGEETSAAGPADPGPGVAGEGPGVRLRGPRRARARSSRASPTNGPGLRRLYVCLTRAVSGLTVLHASELPGALG